MRSALISEASIEAWCLKTTSCLAQSTQIVRTMRLGLWRSLEGRRAWLSALITRRVPLAEWRDALERRPNDVKVIVEFEAHA